MARTARRTDALPAVPGLSAAWEHCQSTEGLRAYVAAVEASVNRGEYRALVGTHGVCWLAVSERGALGTEHASAKATPVLDAAHAAGRTSLVEDGSGLPGLAVSIG